MTSKENIYQNHNLNELLNENNMCNAYQSTSTSNSVGFSPTAPLTCQNIKRSRDVGDVLNDLSPMKRLKITSKDERQEESAQTKETRSKKGFNFLSACQRVSTNEYYDVRKRMEMVNVPDCCNYVVCTKHNGSHVPFQILPYGKEAFRIDMKSHMWCEALDTFRALLKHNKFPSVDIVLDILQMINGDLKTSEISPEFIIKRCQNAIKLLFVVQPPCSETVRDFYRDLLSNPINIMENSLSYQALYDPKSGVFKNLTSILENELQTSCNDISDVDCANKSAFENLNKSARIQRLMLSIELITDLLEKDLAIWMSKHFHNPRKHMVKKQKPLMALILWQNSVIHFGLVNNNCRQIFQILILLLQYQYPAYYVQIFKRLLNLIYQVFYLCGDVSKDFYPDIRNHCSMLSNEFFKLIKDKNIDFTLTVMDNVKPKEFKYLLSKCLVVTLLKSTEPNFIVLLQNIFKNHWWTNFEDDSKISKPLHLSSTLQNFVSLLHHNSLKYFYLHLLDGLPLESFIFDINTGPKRKLKQYLFLDTLYFSFVHFLKTFNVTHIQDYYDKLCNNDIVFTQNEYKTTSNNDVEVKLTDKLFPMSEDCFKEYRLIFTTLKRISVHHAEVKEDFPHVYKMFQNIEVL